MKARVYTRPDKPLAIAVKRRERPDETAPREIAAPVAVDKSTECHVTPPGVAARMVDYLGPQGDYQTLEPSAGTGALCKALIDSGHSPYELTAIERHTKLAASLSRFDCGVINRCFLEYAAEARGKIQFPRIIMNPPFKQVRKHIEAAAGLLGENGHADITPKIIALVPITYQHDRAEDIESLGPDTFSAAKVYTKIIEFV